MIYIRNQGFYKSGKSILCIRNAKKMIFNSYFMQACEEGKMFGDHINDAELRKDVQERLKETETILRRVRKTT